MKFIEKTRVWNEKPYRVPEINNNANRGGGLERNERTLVLSFQVHHEVQLGLYRRNISERSKQDFVVELERILAQWHSADS